MKKVTAEQIKARIWENTKNLLNLYTAQLSHSAGEPVSVEIIDRKDLLIKGSDLAVYKLAYLNKIYKPKVGSFSLNGEKFLILQNFHTPVRKSDVIYIINPDAV